MTSTSYPISPSAQVQACWLGMSIAVLGGAPYIEASPLSYRCWKEFQACMEGNEQFGTSDFTTSGTKQKSDVRIQRMTYVHQQTSSEEGDKKSVVEIRPDSDVTAEENMRAERKSNALGSIATSSAVDLLAFEGFEINTLDEAERTAVLRVLSEATWQQQNDDEIKEWTKRPGAEDRSTEEDTTLVVINSNDALLMSEPSSLVTWTVAGLFVATAIYLEGCKRRLENS